MNPQLYFTFKCVFYLFRAWSCLADSNV